MRSTLEAAWPLSSALERLNSALLAILRGNKTNRVGLTPHGKVTNSKVLPSTPTTQPTQTNYTARSPGGLGTLQSYLA